MLVTRKSFSLVANIKLLATILLIIISSNSTFSQSEEKSLVILDKENFSPIQFANIHIKGSRGTYSNKNGTFSINISKSDTLVISCIGYQSASVIPYLLKENDTILLQQEALVLDELIISSTTKTKIQTVGNHSYKTDIFGMALTGFEYCTFIPNTTNTKTYASKILVKIKRHNNYKTALRLHLYENDNGKPGKEILIKNTIAISEHKNDKLLTFDISKYNILFDKKGVFIGIEWIGKIDDNGNIISTSGETTEPLIGFTEKVKERNTWERYRAKNEKWSLYNIRKYIPNFKDVPINAAFGIELEK